MADKVQRGKTAEELAKEQKAISVAEFFEKNRHLLGFDNPTKALLTVVKEAVDNSLDACEEAKILPEIKVEIDQSEETKFKVIIEDNGPGIVKEQIPNIFAKLLYGSKFHKLRQSRGQQGIGISAAVLYGQLTTGKAAIIHSRPKKEGKTLVFHLKIDVTKNEPEIVKEEIVDDGIKHTGTRITLFIEGKYIQKKQSVDEYIKQTAIVNPWATLIYKSPEGTKVEYKRTVNELPKLPTQIKPHPHGIELGILGRMLRFSASRTLLNFLQNDFSRVGSTSAEEICRLAGVNGKMKPQELGHEQQEKLLKAMQTVQIMRPPTDCLSPIGERQFADGLRQITGAEFVTSVTREPEVYRGNPFQVEVAIAYGGALAPKQGVTTNISSGAAEEEEEQKQARLLRYANRMPLLYEQSACAVTKAVQSIKWKTYGLDQPGGGLPVGPVVIAVHFASVWVPYTSEGKEALASYPEIIEEVKLAAQEAGRKLARYLAGIRKGQERQKRHSLFEMYIPELAHDLAKLSGEKKEKLEEGLKKFLKKNIAKIIEVGDANVGKE